MNAYEISCAFTPPKKGTVPNNTLRCTADDLNTAIQKVCAWLTTNGCTGITTRSAICVWPIDVP